MNRLLLFVIYNKQSKLEKRTVYSLEKVRSYYNKVIIISNCNLSKRSKKQLIKLSDDIIYRENKGFDFSAWRDGMQYIGHENLSDYDTVTIMNDTCYFPVFDFKTIFLEMDNEEAIDFWGASVHKATKSGMPGTDGPVPEHIQSYFITYKKKLVKASVFKDFWQKVKDFENVDLVIQNYETQMTSIFKNAGFKYDALFNPKNLNNYGNNIVDAVYEVPEKLLEEKFPFIKTKVITAGRVKTIKNILKEKNSKYPLRFIKKHEIHSLQNMVKHRIKI